jgi:hypothetical protein
MKGCIRTVRFKTNQMKAIIILSLGAVLFSSCAKDIANFERQYSNVDTELWTFYSNFEYEAEKRGVTVNLQQLQVSGEIAEIDEAGVAGSCQYGSAISNHVTIDETFWRKSSNSFKEFIVFHELGHCALNRGHDETQNEEGLCLSIMRSGLGNCVDAYSTVNRTAYLDELFYEKD